MCSAGSAWTLLQTGCPIRIPPDHRLLPTPRRFSQVAASFLGVWCLGIHLGPLLACPAYDHSSSLKNPRRQVSRSTLLSKEDPDSPRAFSTRFLELLDLFG